MKPFRSFLNIQVIIQASLLLLSGTLFAQTNRSSSTNRSTSTSRSTGSARSNTSSAYGSSNGSGIRQYRSNTMLGEATIQVDAESRSVVVVADEETNKEITKVIEELDHPKPQVLIKVVFVEVSLNKELDVGLEGSYAFKVGSGTPLLSGTQVAATGVGAIQSLFGLASAANSSGVIASAAATNWSATLHALESRGNLRILSRPSIMARNNQEAVIVVGQEIPFITNSQITENGTVNNTVQYQDVGIILRVTPYITAEKSVEMIVNPEISSLSDQTIPISTTVNAAVINKRSAETVVVTPNATTVVIGGMMQKHGTSKIMKVPILGDIPVLGLPFRHTVKGEEKTELMIFLTPYIVEGTSKLKDLTLREANKADFSGDGFPKEDLSFDSLQLIPEAQK